MAYTNVFTNTPLQPAQASYRALTTAVSLTFNWPPFSQTTTDLLATWMDVTTTVASLTMTMPAANLAGVGVGTLWVNRGGNTFTVADSTGATLTTVTPGQAKMVTVADNTTAAGTWSIYTLGTGTSTPDASALAGRGLEAASSALRTAFPSVAVSSTPYSVDATTSRAAMITWTSGAGTFNLPTLASAGTSFFFLVRNAGTGVLTLDPNGAEQIDGSATITLNPTESCVVVATATSWYTVGRGRNQNFSFTQLVKSVTGGAVSLTSTEAANVVQKYQGTLTSDCTVTLPSIVQVYYIQNATAGAFSLTFKCGAGTTVTVPQNQNSILFADGVNVINASTNVSGITNLTLNPGAVGSPTINFTGDLTTGIYSPSAGTIAFATGGVQIAAFSASAFSAAGFAPTGSSVPANGMFRPAANTLGFSTNSVERLRISTTAVDVVSGALTVGGSAVALLASPTFTGTPAAPTPTAGDNSTKIATTAFVTNAVGTGGFVQTSRLIATGTGLSGGGNLTADRTLTFDTTWGDARYQLLSGMSSYLTTASAAATYQTIAGMSSYLTTATAASTYQTQAGMSAYAALASAPAFTGAVASGTTGTAGSFQVKRSSDGAVVWRMEATSSDLQFFNVSAGAQQALFSGADFSLTRAGGLLKLARVSDGASVGQVGSRSGTDVSLYNSGGGSAELVVATNGVLAKVGGTTVGNFDSSNNLTVTGLIKGNNGGAGLGQITVSTSAATGGSDGDVWFQY